MPQYIYALGKASGSDLVKAQCLSIGFKSLLIVFLALLDEAKDVPTYVRSEIEADALLHKLETFVAPTEMCQDESLHTQGFYNAYEVRYEHLHCNTTYRHGWETF